MVSKQTLSDKLSLPVTGKQKSNFGDKFKLKLIITYNLEFLMKYHKNVMQVIFIWKIWCTVEIWFQFQAVGKVGSGKENHVFQMHVVGKVGSGEENAVAECFFFFLNVIIYIYIYIFIYKKMRWQSFF